MIVRRDRVQAVEPSDVILEVRRSEEAVERLAGDDDAREGRESLLTKKRKSGRLATDRRADRLHVHPRQIHTQLVHAYVSSSSDLGPISQDVSNPISGLRARDCECCYEITDLCNNVSSPSLKETRHGTGTA